MEVPRHGSSSKDCTLASAASRLWGTRLWTTGFLSLEELEALEAAALPDRSYGPGSVLIREGETADTVFIVIDGWAYRYATTREGGRQLPALLVPGDIGNLDALMFDRLDYGVQAITQVTVLGLPRDRLRLLFAQHPGIARTFTWLAMVENTILSRWALSLCRRGALERLAHLLCELSVRLDGEEGDASRFAFPLTQEQIADTLGLTSVHVNRMMQTLKSWRLVVTSSRNMTIPAVAELRRFSGFDPSYLHVTPVVRSRPAG
jgi:CRP-like cAMP-binding protein